MIVLCLKLELWHSDSSLVYNPSNDARWAGLRRKRQVLLAESAGSEAWGEAVFLRSQLSKIRGAL